MRASMRSNLLARFSLRCRACRSAHPLTDEDTARPMAEATEENMCLALSAPSPRYHYRNFGSALHAVPYGRHA